VLAAALALTGTAAAPAAEETLTVDGAVYRVDRAAKRPTYDLAWPIRQPPAEQRAAPLEMAFLFAAQDAEHFHRVAMGADGWRVERREGEVTTVLERRPQPLHLEAAGEFVLRRRQHWLVGIWSGQVLFRIPESASGEGTAATWSAVPDLVGPSQFQAVAEEEMALRDDFLRTPGVKAEGVWEVAGQWKLQSYADEWRGESPMDPMNTARNPNPFVYRGTGSPRATALAGQPFWDDLTGTVSVRSQGGRAGWLFSYRAPTDYFVLWWEPTGRWEQPSRFALERVREGKTEVLAETWVAGSREQWYRMAVEVRGPQIVARLQGAALLRASDAACLGGRFGLCAADGDADFDDVDVRRSPIRPLEENWFRKRAEPSPPGDWGWTGAGAARRDTGHRGRAGLAFDPPGLHWRRLAVSLVTPAEDDGILGLRLGRLDDAEVSFLWESTGHLRPEARLVARKGSRERVLAQARGGFTSGTPLRLLVDLARGDLCVAEVGAGLVLRLPKCPLSTDGLALLCEGDGEFRFEDLVLDGPDERDWEKPVKTAIFVKDHYMLDWAAAEGQWVPDVAAGAAVHRWWHKGDFFGAAELDLPLGAARQAEGLGVFLLARENRPDSGCAVRVRPQRGRGADGRLSATVSWRGRRLAVKDFEPGPGATALTLHLDGSFVWLECGDAEPVFLQLPNLEPRGTGVGLELVDPRWLEEVTVRRDHVVDDQFEEVATRWRSIGRWEVSNKFHCDPRWAYMVGESDGLAALWHLDSFPGDLTLEFYAGMRYRAQFDFMPYYPRPGDINAAIASSGDSVWDGYTAVVSGWESTWTRLLREGRIVAETDQPLVPSIRRTYHRPQELHRRWFYVKLRRVGPRLELYFENRKVLSWEDGDPLGNGRLALWTVDNSILVARTKISYSRREPFLPVPLAGPSPAPPPQPPPAETLRLTSETHPGRRFTFDTPGDLEGWQETGSTDDARVTWDSRDAGGGHGCLRLTNGCPGGRFIVQVPLKGLELRRASRLAFAWRASPEIKVNLYLRAGGQQYVIRLTGPTVSDESLQDLGQIEVGTARGWQRLEFPLGEALAAKRLAETSLPLEEMHFGVERGEYLLAGLGGNPGGAYVLLDEFGISSEGPEDCRLRVADGAGTALASGTYTIVSGDGTAVCTDKALSGGAIAEKLPPGDYLVRAAKAGTAAVASLRLHVVSPPVVAELAPEAASAWGGDVAGVRFEPGPLVPTWALEWVAAGKSLTVDGSALRYSVPERTLALDPAAAGLALRDGEACAFTLRTKAPAAVLKEWTLTYRRAEDHAAPGPVQVKEVLVHDTFESGLGAWTRIGRDGKGREHGALLVRDSATAAAGQYSLKLLNELVGGVAGAQVTGQSFNAGRQPLLAFDCRMPEEMLIDLLLVARGMECRMALTDNDYLNTAWPLGRFLPEFRQDGTWQHLEVNLRELLAASPWVAGQFDVSNLRLGDGGWQGNRQGAAFWVDNVTLGPCLSAVGEGVALNWTATDPGGIAGYSYHWSGEPREEAPTAMAVEAPGARFRGLPEGRLHFHIRATDTAGNWGETSHWPFLIDNTPPQLRRQDPAPDAETAAREVSVELADPLAGIDPSSLSLTLNGRAFAPGQPGVEVDLGQGRLTVDWVTAGMAAPAEGQAFEVSLGPVKDFAGNASTPVAWKWRFAPRHDRRAPLAPVIAWSGGKVAQQVTLETPAPILSASPPVWLDRVVDPEAGSLVQRVCVGGSGVDVRVALPSAIDASTHRWLSFRYRFPPCLKIDLAGYLQDPDPEKQQMIIKLTDADVRPDYVTHAGRVEGILRDDRWHTALVDLKTHVESREHLKPDQKPQSYAISSLAFADVGFNRHAPGTTFYLDDVVVTAPGPAAASFALTAADESGIAGFACSFDRRAESLPPWETTVTPGTPYAVTFPEKGLWYVHACALDNAGNWSTAAHFAYVVE
jgi:hypothetical protein